MSAATSGVVGVDLSLTATGVAYGHTTELITVKDVRGMERIEVILDEVMRCWRNANDGNIYDNDGLVVVEDYAFSAHGAHAHALGELGGVVRFTLSQLGIRYVDVNPSILKKFTTGKGNASKDQMLSAAIRRWEFPGEDNNEADAWMLKIMGEYARSEVYPGFKPAAEALAKVTWPWPGDYVPPTQVVGEVGGVSEEFAEDTSLTGDP